MRFVGLDLHKSKSQLCVLDDETGEVIEQRIDTRTQAFAEFFQGSGRCRILLEAGTESEWVARTLEAMGHEVIVADPNFAPMYATRSRKVKTDKRDARALAEAAQRGIWRPAHRLSDAQWRVRNELTVRDALIGLRTKSINSVRAITRQHGLRIPSGSAETFHKRVGEMVLGEMLEVLLAPLVETIELLTSKIRACDESVEARGSDETTQLLQSVPNVGPVTSVAFVATLDNTDRFESARNVAAYVGLVPSERSSGEKQSRGSITKRGNGRLRWLLVQAAHGILRRRTPRNEGLHVWAKAVEMRRGKNVAVVALARRLARILFAVWRDRVAFSPSRFEAPRAGSLAVGS